MVERKRKSQMTRTDDSQSSETETRSELLVNVVNVDWMLEERRQKMDDERSRSKQKSTRFPVILCPLSGPSSRIVLFVDYWK